MTLSDRKKRKRKRLLDGRQKETRRKTKNKTTHRNEVIQEYFQSILITPHPMKRKRNRIEIEQHECISTTLDTET